MNLLGTTIFVQNTSLVDGGEVWCSGGLPSNAVEKYPLIGRDVVTNETFPIMVGGSEFFVRCPVEADEKRELVVELDPLGDVPEDARAATAGAYRNVGLSSWVLDDIKQLVPTFRVEWDGVFHDNDPIQIIGDPEILGPRIRYHLRAGFTQAYSAYSETYDCFLWIDMWVDIMDNQELVEFKIRMDWGTLEQPAEINGVRHYNTNGRLNSVRMITGEEPVIDHYIPKSLPAPAQTAEGWVSYLARPNEEFWGGHQPALWVKSTAVRIWGALKCRPSPDNNPAATNNDPRWTNMAFRNTGNIKTMLSKEDWAGRWGPCGPVPYFDIDPEVRLADFYGHCRAREVQTPYNTGGSSNWYVEGENPINPYRHANAPDSGRSGAQADFGVTSVTFCIGFNEPGALHFYERDTDGWVRRPFHYRRSDGTMATNRPDYDDSYWYNGFPHSGQSGSNYLGWHDNVPAWVSGSNIALAHWQGFTEQHSAMNHICGMYALTRDPSLVDTILGFIHIAQHHYVMQWEPNPESGLGDPRSWGRPLMSAAWIYYLGFKQEAIVSIEYIVDRCIITRYGQRAELVNKPLKPLSITQGANGYPNEIYGSGISPWQDSIMAMGLFEIWSMNILDDERQAEIKQIMIDISFTNAITVYQENGVGPYLCSWNYIWNHNDPGEPWPESQLWPEYWIPDPNNPGQQLRVFNPYVNTYAGGLDWVVPSLQIGEFFRIMDDPASAQGRAGDILEYVGPSIYKTSQAQWRCLVPWIH